MNSSLPRSIRLPMKMGLIPLLLAVGAVPSRAETPEEISRLVQSALLNEVIGESVWRVDQHFQDKLSGYEIQAKFLQSEADALESKPTKTEKDLDEISFKRHHAQELARKADRRHFYTLKTQAWGPNHWYFRRQSDEQAFPTDVYSTKEGLLFIEKDFETMKSLSITRYTPGFALPYVPAVPYFFALNSFANVDSLHYSRKGEVGLLEVKSHPPVAETLLTPADKSVVELNPDTFAWISISDYAGDRLLRRVRKEGENYLFESFNDPRSTMPSDTTKAILQWRNPDGGAFKDGIYRIPESIHSISSGIPGFQVGGDRVKDVVGRRLTSDLQFVD